MSSSVLAGKEAALSLNEIAFLRTSLAAGLRLDGRALTDVRRVTLSFLGASGTVQAQIGETRVVAVVTADLAAPFADRPNEGALNLFVNFAPIASPAFEVGHPSDRGVEVSRIVERGLRESRAIDLESLCVLAGEKVWNIRCDVHVLDQSGNMLDAINLAAVTALLHFRRPDVTVVGDSVTVHSVEDRQPVALALHHIPISCSFAFFDAASAPGAASASSVPSQPLMVVDPSLKEELCADSGLTVTLNVHGEICCLQKSGGLGIDLAQLLLATQVAQAKTLDLTALVQSRLKDDAALANTGNAVRGSLPTKALFHTAPAAKPIDAFGTNVTRAPGTHITAGRPIEIDMDATSSGAAGAKESRRDDSEEDDEEEDEDEEEEDDEDAEGEDDNDAGMQDQAEFAAVAQKLQAKGAPAAAPTSANAAATKAKKK